MNCLHKCLTLALIAVTAVSCIGLFTVKPANAQIPAPSVPQFAVQYAVYTYYYAPTYSINPYTGQNETISSGGQIDNQTIEFMVANQPFTPYTDSNGNYIGLFYNFRCKGHFGTQWTYYPFTPTEQGTLQSTYIKEIEPSAAFPASNTQNTTISIDLSYLNLQNDAQGGQVDFQVQALIGYIGTINIPNDNGNSLFSFTGQSSNWSNTQTLTINYNQNSTVSTALSKQTTSPTPTSTPSVPELSWLVIAPLLLSVFFVAVIFRHRKLRARKLNFHSLLNPFLMFVSGDMLFSMSKSTKAECKSSKRSISSKGSLVQSLLSPLFSNFR